jgi:putative CocE/NonD family hydrolase
MKALKPLGAVGSLEAVPIRRAVPLAFVAILLLAGCLAGSDPAAPAPRPTTANGSAPAAPAAYVERHGYLATRDGTLLAYDLLLPGDGSGSHPTLLEYSGYSPGYQFDSGPSAGYAPTYLAKGYALIGVNIRGTGCSGGVFDFFAPVQADDGYDAVEWAAAQSWSNGKVGMIGKSYPGITQLFVAAKRPPHLVAAAPGHVYGDIYRDVAYPGGIFNYGFAGLWSFVAQPEPGYVAEGNQVAGGDATCAQNVAARAALNTRYNPFVQAQEHPWDDDLIKERSPLYVAQNVTVPLYMVQSWQDEQVGIRGVDVVERLNTTWFLTLSNGDHGMYRTPQSLARLARFLDHYVKGEDNGFENEPRVTVWWDALDATRAPSWVRTYPTWPVSDVEPLRLWLHEGGTLTTAAPAGAETADTYAYGGSSSNDAGYGYWPNHNPPTYLATPGPTRLVYTSAPLDHDVVALGPANLTFWASSTAPDTDFQVTLSYLTPDGRETHVQNGWLRASHRALDPARSTPYRPFQTHQQADQALLTPGTPVEMSVEVFAFGQAFRAGTQVRVAIEAPTTIPELWAFAPTPLPALNTVLHDAQHPALLTLPVLPGERPDAPEPACGAMIRQSCR